MQYKRRDAPMARPYIFYQTSFLRLTSNVSRPTRAYTRAAVDPPARSTADRNHQSPS